MAVYESMKDSRVGWLGKIPSSWRTMLVKHIFSIKKNIANESGHTVLSVTQRGIIPKNMTDKGQFAKDYSHYQLVSSGEFVMNHMDLLTGWIDISKYDGVTSPDYRVFINEYPEQFIAEYYKYVFQYCYFNRIFYGLGQGVAGFGRWRLPADMFLNFVLPVPSVSEQSAIAAYLDNQCAKIDTLIEEAKASIEEYKQWKASLINEIVTQGLKSNTARKSSNVEWIDSIPYTWNVFRLKNLFSFSKGLSITKADLVDSGLPVISYGQIHSKNNTGTCLADELLRYVPEKYLDKSPECLIKYGDLILADTSEDLNGLGNAVFMDRNDTVFAGYHTIVMHPKDSTDSKYLSYLLKTDCWRSQLRSNASGIKVFSVTQKMLRACTIILPPKDEQKSIVSYLDDKCGLINAIIQNKTELINDLTEYKRSLIFETVTGKRKVV